MERERRPRGRATGTEVIEHGIGVEEERYEA